MPTDRKVLVLADRAKVQATLDWVVRQLDGLSPAEAPIHGPSLVTYKNALSSALDKEAVEREEWRVTGDPDSPHASDHLAGPFDTLEEAQKADYNTIGMSVIWRNPRIQRRTITTFEDGEELRSAWRDCEGEDG